MNLKKRDQLLAKLIDDLAMMTGDETSEKSAKPEVEILSVEPSESQDEESKDSADLEGMLEESDEEPLLDEESEELPEDEELLPEPKEDPKARLKKLMR